MISSVVLIEDSKAYKKWCNPFLRRTNDSGLTKMAAALRQFGKELDLSRMDHRWRTFTLEPYGDHSVTRSSSSCLVYDF